MKVGNGSTAWNDLAYAGSGVTLIEGLNDVDDMTPTDNQVLTWDAGTSMWSSQTTSAGGFTPQVQPDKEDISVDGSNNIFISGQGKTYVYSGANTIIVSSATADAGSLSDLTIDVDKDWNAKGIHNLTCVSSTSMSSATAQIGHIEGTWAGENIDSAQITLDNFIMSTNAISRFADSSNYSTHKGNINNPHEVAWSDVSIAAKSDLEHYYAPASGYH